MSSSPVQESAALADRLETVRAENQPAQIQIVKGSDGTDVALQPAKYFEEDKKDEYYEAKKLVTAAAKDKDTIGLGTEVLVTPEDIDYLIRQKTKSDLIDYDTWFFQTFDPKSDPNKLKLFREMNPEFFNRREQEITKQVEIAKKLAKLGMRGPRTTQEIELLYALDTGKIDAPDLDMLFPEKAVLKDKAKIEEYNKKAVTQGYWNPRQYTKDATIQKRNVYSDSQFLFKSDAERGNPIRKAPKDIKPATFFSQWLK